MKTFKHLVNGLVLVAVLAGNAIAGTPDELRAIVARVQDGKNLTVGQRKQLVGHKTVLAFVNKKSGYIAVDSRQDAIAALEDEIKRLTPAAPSASTEAAFVANTVNFSSSSEDEEEMNIDDNQDPVGLVAQIIPTASNLLAQEQELVVNKEADRLAKEEADRLEQIRLEQVELRRQVEVDQAEEFLREEEEELAYQIEEANLFEEANFVQAVNRVEENFLRQRAAEILARQQQEWGNFLNQEELSDSDSDDSSFDDSDVKVDAKQELRRSPRIAELRKQLDGLKIPTNGQNEFLTTMWNNGKEFLVKATPMAPTAVTAGLSLWRVVATAAASGMDPIEIGTATAIAGTLTFTTHIAGKLLQKRKRDDSAHDGSNKKSCTDAAQDQNQQVNNSSHFGFLNRFHNPFSKTLKSGGDTIVVDSDSSDDDMFEDNQDDSSSQKSENKAPVQSHLDRALQGFKNLFRKKQDPVKPTDEKKDESSEEEDFE